MINRYVFHHSADQDDLDEVERRHQETIERLKFWAIDVALPVIMVLFVMMVNIGCFWILLHTEYHRDERSWALSIVTATLVGIVGYAAGRASR